MRPIDLARTLEQLRDASGGNPAVERMAGYGLMGLVFESGHVLAFRRITASSMGPPYISLWHGDPDGRWVIHTNVAPSRSCPRYFGPALRAYHVDEIEITWTGAAELSVAATRARLHLALRLAASPLTRTLAAVSRAMPAGLWESPHTGAVAGRLLRTGTLTLAGITPSGHRFIIRPRALWRVAAAAAVIEGCDAGAIALRAGRAALGAFVIPTPPLFAAGRVDFLAPEAARTRHAEAAPMPFTS